MVFDQIQVTNNTARNEGGGMYFTTSTVEIHNCEAVNNSVKFTYYVEFSNFGLITRESKFQSTYLHLPDAERSCIVIDSDSVAEMQHTYLPNLASNCTFVARNNSQILVDSIYYTDLNYIRKTHLFSGSNENILCTDDTSNAQRIFDG